jgi:adenylate cyclase
MILGIGGITFGLASSLILTIEDINQRDTLRQADTVYAAIESLMLPGQAPIAQGYFQRLNIVDQDLRVQLYRDSGEQAFLDNKTINYVNSYLMNPRFETREDPPQPPRINPQNDQLFTQALGAEGVPRDAFEHISIEDRTYFRVLKPLINLPKCTVCHGADHTIRGILEIKSDITETIMLQQTSVIASGGAFFALVLILGFGMSRFMGKIILKPIYRIAEACTLVTDGDFSSRVELQQNDEIGGLASRINQMIEGLLERFKLTQYVSTSTMKSLSSAATSGVSIELTLFFTDIRGFTSYSETNPPEIVVSNLNKVLDIQTKIIHEFGGDIDKYVGDEIFAIFEGPLGCCRAAEAAIKIQEELTKPGLTYGGLQVGIGINRGSVIMGRMGSEARADFTVIGDNVNIAARLCSAADGGANLVTIEYAKALKTCLTEEASKGQKSHFALTGPYRLSVKGKREALKVYKLIQKEGKHHD